MSQRFQLDCQLAVNSTVSASREHLYPANALVARTEPIIAIQTNVNVRGGREECEELRLATRSRMESCAAGFIVVNAFSLIHWRFHNLSPLSGLV